MLLLQLVFFFLFVGFCPGDPILLINTTAIYGMGMLSSRGVAPRTEMACTNGGMGEMERSLKYIIVAVVSGLVGSFETKRINV